MIFLQDWFCEMARLLECGLTDFTVQVRTLYDEVNKYFNQVL